MARVDIFLKKYYTDFHDVDEETRSVVIHGGWWTNLGGGWQGIVYRDIKYSPSYTSDDVASSNTQNMKLYG